ncbi:DUF4267 domain-containing protein [Streptomyces sp. URMC 126]|uniref:DUF4267 domain-containing protein n=1 Tax=Streptomyces sp. URMC 126 TaxID=3423401 RepID=UPI003F19CB0A
MSTYLAYGLAVVLDLLVLFVGLRFLLVPRAAAAGYGVPAAGYGVAAVKAAGPAAKAGDPAYLTVKGLRDTAYGLMGLALLSFAGARAEAWYMLVVALLPLGDVVIVLRNGGTRAAAFGIHATTAALVLADAALLFTL